MIHLQIKCINAEISTIERLQVESRFYQAFDRFEHFIREAQLTLRDTNGPKGGVDKICTIQLRFYPRGVAVVRCSSSSFAKAANVACDKMQQVTAKRLGRKKSEPRKNLPRSLKERYTISSS